MGIWPGRENGQQAMWNECVLLTVSAWDSFFQAAETDEFDEPLLWM